MVTPDSTPHSREYEETPYAPMLDSVWQRVGLLHDDTADLHWYHPHRYDGEVARMRAELAEVIMGREAHETGEGFRDYHMLRFLRHALDAIVNIPQMQRAALGEVTNIRDVHALGLRYAATQALIGAQHDSRRFQSGEHRGHYTGLVNELVPIALLNRDVVVTRDNTLTIPGSREEDHYRLTDIKTIPLDNPEATTPIQIKTSHAGSSRAPRNGLVLYAQDFGNEAGETSRLIEANPQTSDTLDQRAVALANHLIYLNSPSLREAREKARRRAARDHRFKTGHYDLKQNIGDAFPDLAALRDELLS